MSGAAAPFAAARRAIPVTIVTDGELPQLDGASLITIEPSSGHDHSGAECLVCSTRGNIRVLLFELLEQRRFAGADVPAAVIVDARQAGDPQTIVDALVPGRTPAFGLRDHTVLKSFRLDA
jgi:hypothetical protein